MSDDVGSRSSGPSAVILAGGASRRMGRDKATIPIGDATLLGRVVEGLLGIGGLSRIIVVGSRVRDLDDALGVGARSRTASRTITFVEDRWPGEGPLGGLITGLRVLQTGVDGAEGPAVTVPETDGISFVLSCDMPNLSFDELTPLLEALEASPFIDAVLSTRLGRSQPLHSALRFSSCGLLERAFLAGERRLEAAFAGLNVRYRPDRVGSSDDIDTPHDLEKLLRTRSEGSVAD